MESRQAEALNQLQLQVLKEVNEKLQEYITVKKDKERRHKPTQTQRMENGLEERKRYLNKQGSREERTQSRSGVRKLQPKRNAPDHNNQHERGS